jgi:hypothetical protein
MNRHERRAQQAQHKLENNTAWMEQWLTQPQKDQDGWWWGMMCGKLMIYPKEKRVEVLEMFGNVVINHKTMTEFSIRAMKSTLKCIKKLGWKVDKEERIYGKQTFEPRAHNIIVDDKAPFQVIMNHGTEDNGPG